MTALTFLRGRVEPAPLTGVLAVGDVLAITAFVVVGEISHGIDPLANAPRVAGVIAPFLIGWAVAAVVGSLYTRDALRPLVRAASWTLPAWILAVIIAQALRATPLFPGGAALTFALVSMAVGGGLLIAWRALVGVVGVKET